MGDAFSSRAQSTITSSNTSTDIRSDNQQVTAGEGAVAARGNVNITTSDAGSILRVLDLAQEINARSLEAIAGIVESENEFSYQGRQLDAASVGSSIGAARSLAEGAATGGASIIGDKFSKILLYGLLGIGAILLFTMFRKKRKH